MCGVVLLRLMLRGLFVLAYRVMELIIRDNGNNAWLAEGTPHYGVRHDFVDTDDGTRRKVIRSV